MTGLDVCRALRAVAATAGIPVLMLSGWAFESDVAGGHAAGADGYLAKPFANAELRTRVQELINQTTARTAAAGAAPAPAG
jgi:DNA-binding response OmpR family regulator